MDNYSTPRPMKRIGDLFDKYHQHFKAPQATVEKAFLDIVKNFTDYKISINQITYTVSTRTIKLNIPSVVKSDLSIHYPIIIEKLEEVLGKGVSPKTIL